MRFENLVNPDGPFEMFTTERTVRVLERVTEDGTTLVFIPISRRGYVWNRRSRNMEAASLYLQKERRQILDHGYGVPVHDTD